MPDQIPLGEEIWLRRDHRRHGGRFYFREPVLYFFFIIGTLGIFVLIWIVLIEISHHFMPWRLKLASVVILIYAVFLFARSYLSTLKSTSLCPAWFYAEQLNSEQLTIYHLRKPPTIIKLAHSSLDTKTKLKHYTTLIITDKYAKATATLELLTPEEYDRFMQYWNAAQEQTLA